MFKRLTAAALCIALTGCAAIEIPSNPEMPELRLEHPQAPGVAAAAAGTSISMPVDLMEGLSPSSMDKPSSGSLNLSVEGATILALDGNRQLQVDKINPMLQETLIATQRAVFDPVVSADLLYSRTRSDSPGSAPGTPRKTPVVESRSTHGSVGISEDLPTGTNIGLTFSDTKSTVQNFGDPFPVTAAAGISISQQLLRGAGLNVGLVSLRQARLDRLSSDYELRGVAQSLVASVENAYWDALLAARQVKIFEDARAVAQKQLDETLERIKVGQLADTERFSAQSEVALRQEDLINGRSQLEKATLALQRLISASGNSLAPRPIALTSEPILPEAPADDPEQHIALALRMRPDLNQARLSLERNELDIVRTKNGLLPQLELFINLGKSGYSNSFSGGATDIISSNSNNASAEMQFSYALGNRAAQAAHKRATLTHVQQIESILNLRQLVEQDVRGALIEIRRVREQVAATAVTRQLQEETLRTEQEKYRVGRSTQLLVAQAERDLLSAQISEIQARTAYLKAITSLYQLDGSLLDRRGVVCPGEEPVALADEPTAP